MSPKQLNLGIVTTLVVFGAYFIGPFRDARRLIQWRELFRSFFQRGDLERVCLGGFSDNMLGVAVLHIHRTRLAFARATVLWHSGRIDCGGPLSCAPSVPELAV